MASWEINLRDILATGSVRYAYRRAVIALLAALATCGMAGYLYDAETTIAAIIVGSFSAVPIVTWLILQILRYRRLTSICGYVAASALLPIVLLVVRVNAISGESTDVEVVKQLINWIATIYACGVSVAMCALVFP